MQLLPVFVLLVLSQLSLQQSYDPNTAFEMLRASSAAYCQTDQLQVMQCGDICEDLTGFDYQFMNQSTVQINSEESVSFSMFVSTNTNTFVTAFRGTHGLDQLLDEIAHSKAITYSLNNVSNAVVSEYFLTKYQTYLRDDFMANLINAYETYPDFAFYIVGHSLGASLADLGVLDAANVIPKSQLHMYTYGSPRTGDGNFAQAVVDSVSELYRVTHYQDPVPHIPPCIDDILGNCMEWADHPTENDLPVYNAWHTWPEVYYTTVDGLNYTICNDAEDKTCSDQWRLVETRIEYHTTYLNVSTKCLSNGPFGSDSDDSDGSDFNPSSDEDNDELFVKVISY